MHWRGSALPSPRGEPRALLCQWGSQAFCQFAFVNLPFDLTLCGCGTGETAIFSVENRVTFDNLSVLCNNGTNTSSVVWQNRNRR